MCSYLIFALTLVTSTLADVSHINSFNAPIQQAYIYKNPQQIVLPRAIAQQSTAFAQQQQQQDLLQPLNTIQQNQPHFLQQPLLNTNGINNFQNSYDGPELAQPAFLHTKKSSHSKSTRRHKSRTKIPKKPIVTKSFYIHTAPEETDEELLDELRKLEERPRKHFNVLFVKTPAQTSKSATVNLAKAIKGDQKTVVYVLSKKTTASDLRDAIAEGPQEVTKPEVFFIKYRTPEEAEHAQHQIQKQYDALEGPSTIINEGEGPITSVVGALDPSDDENEEEDEEKEGNEEKEQPNIKASNNQFKNPAVFYGQPYLPANRF